jgi:hypothetical protein
MTYLIEEQYVLEIPCKITILHSLFRVQKLTARVHHNNCTLFYLLEHPDEARKKYRRGDRRLLWRCPLADIVREDLQFGGGLAIVRVGVCRGGWGLTVRVTMW